MNDAFSDPFTLFVYGTLMRGGVRGHLLAGQRFLGEARTLPRYALFDLGAYPGMVRRDADGRAVSGELYEVAAGLIPALDPKKGRRRSSGWNPWRSRVATARSSPICISDSVEGAPPCPDGRWVYRGRPMTHDEAFLAAVREAPDDDAPRLLYADWLEERGDPRRLIRAQCVLERLDPADPVRQELEEQTAAILGRHEEEWTAPLRGDRFRLALLARLRGRNHGFGRRLPARRRPVRRLPGHAASPSTHACAGRRPWRASPHLARVRYLDVSSCKLRDGDVTALLASPHLTRLTGLDLAANEVEGPAVLALVGSSLLGRLDLAQLPRNHSLGVRLRGPWRRRRAAASLQSLDLSITNIGPGGTARPARVGLSHQSDRVACGEHRPVRIGRTARAELAATPVLPRLTLLDLGGFPDPKSLSELLRSQSLGRLTSLGLADCQLRREGVESLVWSPHLSHLKSLDLTRNAVGPQDLDRLASSEHLSGLAALHLGHNAVRDTGAKTLAASPALARLTVLDLSHNGIGGPGLQALAASPSLARLTALDLSGNYIGPESVRLLKERFGVRVEL